MVLGTTFVWMACSPRWSCFDWIYFVKKLGPNWSEANFKIQEFFYEFPKVLFDCNTYENFATCQLVKTSKDEDNKNQNIYVFFFILSWLITLEFAATVLVFKINEKIVVNRESETVYGRGQKVKRKIQIHTEMFRNWYYLFFVYPATAGAHEKDEQVRKQEDRRNICFLYNVFRWNALWS